MAIFRRAGMREGGRVATPSSFWFFWYEELVIKIWLWYLHWLQNSKSLKLEWLFFSCFMKWNWRPLSLKSCHFEVRKDIITKFKSQAFHIITIKYWKASGSGNPPSLPHSCPPENCHFRSKNEIFYTFLHTIVIVNRLNDQKFEQLLLLDLLKIWPWGPKNYDLLRK